MTHAELQQSVRDRLEGVLDILAHVSFGKLDLQVPELPEEDAFADLYTGLDVLLADLREARDELEGQVRARTAELEQDIRERRRVEAELRASEATYRMLVESSPAPILLCDREGRIRMVNPALLDAVRVDSAESLLGSPWLDVVAPDHRNKAADCARCLGGGSRIHTVEVTFRRRDGTEFFGELRCSPLRGADGALAGVLSVIHDLTAQRRREQAQLRTEKLESLGTLAGGIAHDFNNSLSAIIGCLSLAAGMLDRGSEPHALLEDAIEAAFRTTALTRQLLTFAKGGVPVKACQHIGTLIERAATFCVRGSSVRCRVDIAADLWPVDVDAGQLEQVLGNLVINAKHAMQQGGTVVVRACNATVEPPEAPGEPRRYVCISVEDSGVGIPPENLARIFEPYFTTKEDGSGLGLTTAYSVVHKHGGFLDCESTVGHGSTFRIHLPASDREPERAPLTLPPDQRGRGRVLVMDDDAMVRRICAQQLGGAGYDVTTVESGTAALASYRDAQLRGERFDVVLMDLTVPGGDGGKETMPRLLELDPTAKGIVVSGYSDDPVLANFREHGFVGRLEKPYALRSLLAVVGGAMGARSSSPVR
jgi:PAS domain S-box-containing protein